MAATKVGIYRSPDRSQVWITTNASRNRNEVLHLSVSTGRWVIETYDKDYFESEDLTVYRLILQTERRDKHVVESSNRELVTSALSEIMRLSPGTGSVIVSLHEEETNRVRVHRVRVESKAEASAVLSLSVGQRGEVEHTTR